MKSEWKCTILSSHTMGQNVNIYRNIVLCLIRPSFLFYPIYIGFRSEERVPTYDSRIDAVPLECSVRCTALIPNHQEEEKEREGLTRCNDQWSGHSQQQHSPQNADRLGTTGPLLATSFSRSSVGVHCRLFGIPSIPELSDSRFGHSHCQWK